MILFFQIFTSFYLFLAINSSGYQLSPGSNIRQESAEKQSWLDQIFRKNMFYPFLWESYVPALIDQLLINDKIQIHRVEIWRKQKRWMVTYWTSPSFCFFKFLPPSIFLWDKQHCLPVKSWKQHYPRKWRKAKLTGSIFQEKHVLSIFVRILCPSFYLSITYLT